MAAKGTSKNSRVSRAAKPAGFEPSPQVDRFIATGAGAFAYVLTPDGKSVHAKVGSDKFVAALEKLHAHPGMDARVTVEVARLDLLYPEAGWKSAWDRVAVVPETVAA